ncbi:transglycosylase domain-containing protein [Shewanella cyperi]|uniref:transglycosylase domain-containing protein n=1 Tax=Shewanella cyperi TaxID=2814292 RepID=UPI001D18F4E4|nr:transglycosylase domain-containing protein [Shewanella cyperi]
MIVEDYKQGWRQHFPTYHFDNRDIALEEYKVAAKNLESEERVFLNASNVTLVSSAALGSLLVGSSGQLMTVFGGIIPSYIISLILLSIIIGFSFISLKYFSDRQRAIIFAGRKVIILRRMLGLSYGNIQLLLPNWRVEGADQPLALKLFPGWLTYAAYPFWIISIISSSVILFLSTNFIKQNPDIIPTEYNVVFIFLMGLVWFMSSMITYRSSLLDTHETSRLIFYKFISRIIGLPVIENVEYIIYRAKLAVYETDRLKVSTENIKKFLIFIEDRDFYNHSGISYKSLIRSVLGLVKIKPRSGGSTIVQQLIRTLFITNLRKTKRRKFIELSLAPWLTKVIGKDLILDIYISSVRFEIRRFGVIEAMEHFWGRVENNPNNAQSFFLIERVSNIRSKLLVNKIVETVRSAKERGLLSDDDVNSLIDIYVDAVKSEKIISDQTELLKLTEGVNA